MRRTFPRAEHNPEDFFSIEVGGRKATIFKPLKGGVRADNFWVKFSFGGRVVFRSTGVNAKGMAAECGRKMLRAAIENRWDALDATKLRNDKPLASIGSLMERYREQIHTYNLTIEARTVTGVVSAVKSVLKRVYPGDVEKLSSGVLTEQLVEKFFAEYVKEAGDDYLARDSKIRGANATLRNARSMFSAHGMKCYRGLNLPDLTKFLKTRIVEDPDVRHEGIPDEVMWEIVQAAECLRSECPPLYVAHLLYRHLGMRNDEVENSRVEWIVRRPGEVFLPDGERREIAGYMSIKRRSYWIPKRSTGDVPISPDVMAIIDELSAGKGANDYLIDAPHPTARYDLVYLDHGDFVRPWLEAFPKKSYELRRWAATRVAKRQGEEFAERFLRHKSTTTAGRHYITDHAPIAPITLADVGLEACSDAGQTCDK
jgi:hypothetical protein